MKEPRKKSLILVILLVLTGLMLSSCSGGGVPLNNWPGVSVYNNAVYLSSMRLYRVNPVDGIQQWRSPEKTDSKHLVYAAPAFSDEAVYVGDYGGTISSLNPNTGSVNWSVQVSAHPLTADLLVVGDLILAPSRDGILYTLNLAGLPQWQFKTGDSIMFGPAVDETQVYLASMDKKLYALDQASGKANWEYDLKAIALDSPVISADGKLVVVSTLGNRVLALDTKTGSLVWEKTLGFAAWSKIAELDGLFCLGDDGGTVSALKIDSGDLVWSVDMGAPVVSGGAVVDNGLVFATEKGDVVKLDAQGGKVWTRLVQGKIYSDLVVTDKQILVGVMGGQNTLVSFDFNGNQIWAFQPAK